MFVGASGGGYLAVGMAERHDDELAGIVLAETPQAIPAEIAAEIEDEIACDAPTNVERRDYAAVEHAVWDDRHLIADVPVRIITDTSDESEPGNAEIQEGWLVLSRKPRRSPSAAAMTSRSTSPRSSSPPSPRSSTSLARAIEFDLAEVDLRGRPAGQMHVRHNDGTEVEIGPGDAYVIEPGHDARVIGSEAVVGYEFDSKAAETFARS